MKKLFLLLFLVTNAVFSQGNATFFDALGIDFPPTINNDSNYILVWNDLTGRVEYTENFALKYIPITGTIIGKPITGDIEFISNGSYKSVFSGNLSESFRRLSFDDDTNFISIESYAFETNDRGKLQIYPNGIVVDSNYSLSKGIEGTRDFTANITDLDYTQKKYVDNAIAAAGGGTITSVNTQTGAVVLTSDNIGDGTTYKQYSATEKDKLSGIASGATANSSDATLLARANHTGTQTASTISDFNTQVATTAALKSNNLSDLASASTARTNLGLGTLATQSGTFTAKQDNITLTTTGASGSASLVSSTLNIPTYTLSGLGGLSTTSAASTYAPIATTPVILLNDNTTSSAVTGTTSNTILVSYAVPANTFASGDKLVVDFLALKSTAVGTATYRIYINTTNSLSGATQIAQFANATGSKFQLMQRNIVFKSSTSLETFISSVGNAYDLGTDMNAPSTITYDTTQSYYLITAVLPTSSSDSFMQSRLSVTKYKSKTTF